MKGLLIEQRPVLFEVLEERSQQNGNMLKVRAPRMSVTDEINGNSRVYRHAIWEREIKKLQKLVQEGRLVGSADHPSDGKSRLTDAALKWLKIYMEGPVTVGEAAVLGTSKGRDLEALIRAGVSIDVSSRAWGSSTRQQFNGKLAEVVGDDLDIITFDAVIGGSVEGASLLAVNEQRIHDRKLAGLPIPDPSPMWENLQFTEEQLHQRRLAGII